MGYIRACMYKYLSPDDARTKYRGEMDVEKTEDPYGDERCSGGGKGILFFCLVYFG